MITGNTRFSDSRLRMPQVHQTENPLTFYLLPPATVHQFSFSSLVSNFAGSHFGCFFNILPLDHALFFILPAHTYQFEHVPYFILPVSTMFYLFLPYFTGYWNVLTVSTIPDICHFFTQSKMPIFRVKSVKNYTGQFFLHRHRLWCLWQIKGMALPCQRLSKSMLVQSQFEVCTRMFKVST